MLTQIAFYERLLRFYDLQSATGIMRARTIYITCWAMVCVQLINMIQMYIVYGGWHLDHNISSVAVGGLLVAIHMLRYSKQFFIYALFLSMLLLAAVGMSAVNSKVGINTSLMPMLIAGCFINAFVSGWRLVMIYTVACMFLIFHLYNISLVNPPDPTVAIPENYHDRISQRAIQTSIALMFVATSCIFISITMESLFEKLEKLMVMVKKSEEDKTKFLAHMNHEMRMPLDCIISANQKLMKGDELSNPELHTEKIQKCGRKLKHILTYAFDLSELDTGQFVLNEAAFNLRDMTSDVLVFAEPHAKKKGLNIGVSYAANIPQIYRGDEDRIKLVLKNLVANALMHTDSGSIYLTVNGRLKGKDSVRLKIKVEDTSAGIPAEELSSIFNRFDHETSSESRASIGLALSHEIIHYMDGSLNVSSILGDGVCFEIILVLPVAEDVDLAEKSDLPPRIAAEQITP